MTLPKTKAAPAAEAPATEADTSKGILVASGWSNVKGDKEFVRFTLDRNHEDGFKLEKDYRLVLFVNDYKKAEKHPDYKLVAYKPKQ